MSRFVVTADPLTLSLRFAAMGELHQTMFCVSTSKGVNIGVLVEFFMTNWSVAWYWRKKTRSGRAFCFSWCVARMKADGTQIPPAFTTPGAQ